MALLYYTMVSCRVLEGLCIQVKYFCFWLESIDAQFKRCIDVELWVPSWLRKRGEIYFAVNGPFFFLLLLGFTFDFVSPNKMILMNTHRRESPIDHCFDLGIELCWKLKAVATLGLVMH